MENSSSRLPSAKWSRNLNEDSQHEVNRLRLLERQRQLLETKMQRRQNHSATVVASRPATSVGGVRARVARQGSTDVLLDSSAMLTLSDDTISSEKVKDGSRHSTASSIARAKTAGTRAVPRHESPGPSVKLVEKLNELSSGAIGTNFTNLSSGTRTMRDHLSRTRSESNINSDTSATNNATGDSDASSKLRAGVISPNPLTTILSDEELLKFVSQPISPEVTLQCTIIRDKKGLDRSLYPTYYMHLQDIIVNTGGSSGEQNETKSGGSVEGTATVWMSESVDSLESINSNDDEPEQKPRNRPNASDLLGVSSSQNGSSTITAVNLNEANNSTNGSNRKVFILSGRRRKKSKTYLIGNNAFDISRDRCLAKLKSNVLGTQFTAIRLHQSGVRYEIASITYETNVLGFKGPRKMTIIVPKTDEKTNVLCNLSLQEELKRHSRAITLLKNKTPIWNEETQSYVLNFHGRVTQASVKNFQLVTVNEGRTQRIANNKSDVLGDMKRSASSGQLGQKYPPGSESGLESSFQGDQYENEEEDEDEEEEDDDSNDEDTTTGYNRTTINQKFASSKSLSRSGYLMASSSEDAKNMAEQANELVSMQFGRVSNTQFSCDVSYPLSLLQAFAITLSSFDSKLACE